MAFEEQRKWWLLGAMSGVLGLIVLDETIVTVSLPSITDELGLSVAASHWVVNAYLLSFTCAVAVAGRFGDHFSRRRYFTIGAALFALASLLAALASSGTMLIAARALQGIGAAIIFPTSIALITAAFKPEIRGVAFGYQTTVGAIFMSSGPLIGGLLTETVSWRMIFWIGIPFLFAIVLLLWRIWSPSYDKRKSQASAAMSKLDTIGPVFLIIALLGLVISVMQGPSWGWFSPVTFCLFFLGCALLASFWYWEVRNPAPLLDLTLLKIPEFRGGVIIFAVFQFEKITIFVFIAQYLQDAVGMSPILSGIAVSIAILPTLGTSLLVGNATDRLGSRQVMVRGIAIHGMAIVLLALVSLWQSYLWTLVPLILWGASMPSIAIPLRRVQMNMVPQEKHGQASGINLTVQMLGGSLGLAACSALHTETKSFAILFLVIGVTTLLSIPITLRTIEKRKASA
ncbi:MFS transporter [Roseibium sp. MMSF_3544]|uniref:MFS transporter n=1 Tax=unclassified Roseibium TaxID=2629323 RepID=UPI00273DC6AC|nr:MFS transporter [Roseibium sp. MMSF_3544]